MTLCSYYADGQHQFRGISLASKIGRDVFDPILVEKCICHAMRPLNPDELSIDQIEWIEQWNKMEYDAAMLRKM